MPLLEVEDVSAGYGDGDDIVKDISLQVDQGEIVTIIGPNGAGKSTALKAITGELKPRTGSVRLNGKDITGKEMYEVLRNGMSFVAQGRNVFPEMTVYENLQMGGYLLDDDEFEANLETIYDYFPILADRSSQQALTMSGGEQQMLEMSMGLLHDPDILLLDEPSAGLAPQIRADVFDQIQDLREEGVTFLMIEQNAREALAISDRGYVLALGEVEMEGTANEILTNDRIRELYLGNMADT